MSVCALCPACLQVRIDKFMIEVDPQQLPGGTRYYLVKGEAIERFAQVRVSVCVSVCGLGTVGCLVVHTCCSLHTVLL